MEIVSEDDFKDGLSFKKVVVERKLGKDKHILKTIFQALKVSVGLIIFVPLIIVAFMLDVFESTEGPKELWEDEYFRTST